VIALAACGGASRAPAPGPDLAVFGESTRLRVGDPHPATTPWFDGKTVTLTAAIGETIGLHLVDRRERPIALSIAGVDIAPYVVGTLPVVRPSTDMYGGSRGAGDYYDAIEPMVSPGQRPTYFELRAARAGKFRGGLTVGDTTYPVWLEVAEVKLPQLAPAIWAYYDPREFKPGGDPASPAPPDDAEQRCVALFREYGIALAPDLDLEAFESRKRSLADFGFIPTTIGDDPATIGANAKAWIERTRGTGQLPFAIPIDEPRDHASRLRVRALADEVRKAGGGPTTFLFGVTDTPQPEYGDAVDLFLTYNGTPPAAGSMVLDARTPGPRTWGWIMQRYGATKIPFWYVWDALYWHDRHNRKRHGLELPGRPLDIRKDAVSFDDNEDHGNLDGVLALPGCRPTLRMAAIRRGLQDRQLIDLARTCDAAATEALVVKLVPKAWREVKAGEATTWPTDEAAWETARRQLVALAGRCQH